ncbi:hypothetical protein P9314_04375 [Paenibacillus validus]|uniref:hypothetical protein n=1 Tax=Paenibacillus validus TaxID=44253 RepID=UPI000FD9E735|nr:hypothetical protein [Paenibacillus validus]MED4599944.1 hypothetical protein [Paenibacillus validus]MED4605884.1 hypothetical protein [Paenibacillus validus]
MKKSFSIWLLLLVISLLPTQNVSAENKQSNEYSKEEPSQFRVQANIFTVEDEKKSKLIPTVSVKKVDFQTGRVFFEKYPFPEYALEIPKGFTKQKISYEDYWASETEVLSYNGRHLFNGSSGFSDGFQGSFINTEDGLKAYFVLSRVFFKNEKVSDKSYTRPAVTTLFEFDMATKKLSIKNQLESNDLYLVNVLPGIKVYGVRGSDSNNYYSLVDHRHLFALPIKAGLRLFDNSGGFPETYNPSAEIGDYIANDPDQTNKYYIIRKDGTMEDAIKLQHVGIHLGNSLYENVSDKYGKFKNMLVTFENGSYETLCEDRSCLGYFSPDKKNLLIRNAIDNNDETLLIYDTNSQRVVKSIKNYALYRGVFPRYSWFGNSIILKKQYYFDGEAELPFLHLPTGIVTLKNDSLITYSHSDVQNTYYNFNPENLITMADPIEVSIRGESVKYSGQGTFITEDYTTYIPLRDFIDSIHGKITVDGINVTVGYNNATLTYNLNDKDNLIVYAGRAYVKIWDIAPKLGFSVELQEPGNKSGTLWRRYILN